MKKAFFSINQPEELTGVVSAREYVTQRLLFSQSPFREVSRLRRFFVAVHRGLIWVAEKIVRSKLYIKNDLRELYAIDARIRALLLFLLEKKIIVSWEYVLPLPDLPPLVYCTVEMGAQQFPSGKVLNLQGGRGGGTGQTVNEALIPALAETLERYSLSIWDPRNILFGSFEELRHRGGVPPKMFVSFSEQQLRLPQFSRSLISDTASFGWVRARSLLTGKKHLIPAQSVYILYDEEHADEPYFSNTSTNGAAAGANYDQALYRALCEAIERDGLFAFWLNKIAPPVIDLESIPFPKIQEHLARFKQYQLELFILDITTDLRVPAFCGVLIDRHGQLAVSMSAVADFDVEHALEKLILEVLKFPHCFSLGVCTAPFEELRQRYDRINTFSERRGLWSDQRMIPEIDFFLQGPKKHFSEIVSFDKNMSAALKVKMIRQILQEKQYACFIVDVSTQEARQAGLYVVKAVLPHLVPAYFFENKRPLGIQRLYSLPVTLGYRTAPLSEGDLNPLPHPFV